MTSPPGHSGLPGYARELVNALEPLTIDDFDFRNRGVPGRNLGTISHWGDCAMAFHGLGRLFRAKLM